jgi:diguanylate cyclase (GGDEF)-like protein
VHRFVSRKSLYAQLVGLGCLVVVLTLVAAIFVAEVPTRFADEEARAGEMFRLLCALIGAGLMTLALLAAGIKRILKPLYTLRDNMIAVIEGRRSAEDPLPLPSGDLQDLKNSFAEVVTNFQRAREDFNSSQRKLAERTAVVDRLLEFSQTVQGAGKADQIFASLGYFLRTQLGLSGVALLANDHDNLQISVKTSWPAELVRAENLLGEMDCALCPCLRQNLPRHFRADGSPVRCSIDRTLSLPVDQPAYCIPFAIGRSVQCVVHMLLPAEQSWTEDRKQLAHTYVNTACSTLVSLHLLAEAEKQSMTDPLTQLYNRRSMEQFLQREVALAERHGHALSLVMIDMDRFKEINDAHGHAAGDYMLKAFADCVRITLRRTDLAFRYGGDEFVIALPQTLLTQAQQVVSKIRQAFGAVDFSAAVTHLENNPTLSIGLAERSKLTNTLTLHQLLAAADEALYDAKNSSRNCVRVYSPARAA